MSFFTISLVLGYASIPVNHLLDPCRRRLHQVLQKICFRCPLAPDLEDGRLQLVKILLRVDSDIFSCFLMVAKGTPALQSSTEPSLNQFWSFFPVCVCWASIAVLCQENDVWCNLYRPTSDKKYSSKNDEISYSSSHIHALLPKKIWGFYLIQEKSY